MSTHQNINTQGLNQTLASVLHSKYLKYTLFTWMFIIALFLIVKLAGEKQSRYPAVDWMDK